MLIEGVVFPPIKESIDKQNPLFNAEAIPDSCWNSLDGLIYRLREKFLDIGMEETVGETRIYPLSRKSYSNRYFLTEKVGSLRKITKDAPYIDCSIVYRDSGCPKGPQTYLCAEILDHNNEITGVNLRTYINLKGGFKEGYLKFPTKSRFKLLPGKDDFLISLLWAEKERNISNEDEQQIKNSLSLAIEGFGILVSEIKSKHSE